MTKRCARECVWRRSITPAVSIAAELDLPFTVGELRAYETKLKLERQAKEEVGEFSYWLLDHGWSNDEAQFCGENEKE